MEVICPDGLPATDQDSIKMRSRTAPQIGAGKRPLALLSLQGNVDVLVCRADLHFSRCGGMCVKRLAPEARRGCSMICY